MYKFGLSGSEFCAKFDCWLSSVGPDCELTNQSPNVPPWLITHDCGDKVAWLDSARAWNEPNQFRLEPEEIRRAIRAGFWHEYVSHVNLVWSARLLFPVFFDANPKISYLKHTLRPERCSLGPRRANRDSKMHTNLASLWETVDTEFTRRKKKWNLHLLDMCIDIVTLLSGFSIVNLKVMYVSLYSVTS